MYPDWTVEIKDIANDLNKRIRDETDSILMMQLERLGIDPDDLEKLKNDKIIVRRLYPDDPLMLAEYLYDDTQILVVRIEKNRMAVKFDVPEIPEGEIQNV